MSSTEQMIRASQIARVCVSVTCDGTIDFGVSPGAYEILLREGAEPRRVLYSDEMTIGVAELSFGDLRLKAQMRLPVSDEDRARLPEYWEEDRKRKVRLAEVAVQEMRSREEERAIILSVVRP